MAKKKKKNRPEGFDPKSGSVKPKHPMMSPCAIPGRYFLRCSSLPNS
jgi:hypothetical protein